MTKEEEVALVLMFGLIPVYTDSRGTLNVSCPQCDMTTYFPGNPAKGITRQDLGKCFSCGGQSAVDWTEGE